MSTTAHHMLNRFRHISQNSTAPAAVAPTSYSADNGADPNAPPMSGTASSAHRSHLKYDRTNLPPTQLPMLTGQALEDLLNGINDTLLPPLALADGGDAFDGDATNDWFYPGRSVRNGMLPDVDLVEIQIMEISRLS